MSSIAAELLALADDEDLSENHEEAIRRIAGRLAKEGDPVEVRRSIGRLLREIVRAKLEYGDGSGERDAALMLLNLSRELDPEADVMEARLAALLSEAKPKSGKGK